MVLPKKLVSKTAMQRLAQSPLLLLFGLALVVVCSYLLSGWGMHPVGDDYASLTAYHEGSFWLTSLPHTVISGGGRYAQTFVSVVAYGSLGQNMLRLTALLGVGLFVLTVSVVVHTWAQANNLAIAKRRLVAGALVFFLLYSMISVTFPWIRGSVDNTFQDFLWLPGFITYTLPFCLIILLTSLLQLFRASIDRRPVWLAGVGLAGIILGTFNEIISLLYLTFMAIWVIYEAARVRQSKRLLNTLLLRFRAFAILGGGLIVGLALNYSSAATTERRADLAITSAPLKQVIAHSLHSTQEYLRTYVFGSSAHDHSALVFAIVAGAALGAYCVLRVTPRVVRLYRQHSLILVFLSLIMAIVSLFVSFVAVYKGYGITSYLAPRFEVLYDGWICLFFVSLGFAAVVVVAVLQKPRINTRYLPWLGGVCLLLLLFNVPRLLNQASARSQTVALFSNNWVRQDRELRQAAQHPQATVTVPVIDIGDSYNIRCNNPMADDWLGQAKQNYYHVRTICSTP